MLEYIDDIEGQMRVFNSFVEARKQKINKICDKYRVPEITRALIIAQVIDILGEAEKIFYKRLTEDNERPVEAPYLKVRSIVNG